MRKQISVTNEKVLQAMEQSDNASKLIERAMLFYLDSIEKEYITKEDMEDFERKITICNQNYLQMRDFFEEMAKEIFKNK